MRPLNFRQQLVRIIQSHAHPIPTNLPPLLLVTFGFFLLTPGCVVPSLPQQPGTSLPTIGCDAAQPPSRNSFLMARTACRFNREHQHHRCGQTRETRCVSVRRRVALCGYALKPPPDRGDAHLAARGDLAAQAVKHFQGYCYWGKFRTIVKDKPL
jgi:hypothetical protein